MKKMIGLLVACMVMSVAAVNAQEDTRRAAAEDMLNAMNMKETMEQSFDMIKKMIPAETEKMAQGSGQKEMLTSVTNQSSKMIDMILEEMSWEKMKADYITLYAETFTEQEMKSITAFYRSPAGQAFIKKQPELMKKSMELSQKMMMRIMPKIQAMTLEMKQEKKRSATPAVDEKKGP